MGLNKQEKSQAQQEEEEALFAALFPQEQAKLEESLALPVRSNETAFKALSLTAKVKFLISFVKNYTRQEYTRWRIRRSMSK